MKCKRFWSRWSKPILFTQYSISNPLRSFHICSSMQRLSYCTVIFQHIWNNLWRAIAWQSFTLAAHRHGSHIEAQRLFTWMLCIELLATIYMVILLGRLYCATEVGLGVGIISLAKIDDRFFETKIIARWFQVWNCSMRYAQRPHMQNGIELILLELEAHSTQRICHPIEN